MNMKKLATTAMTFGVMAGSAAMGVGAGVAQADKGWDDWCGPVLCRDLQGPPGRANVGPPGQFKKEFFIPGTLIPNPVYGVPPGHWDERLGRWIP